VSNGWLELKKPAVWVPIAVAIVVPVIGAVLTFQVTLGKVETRLEDLGNNHNRLEDRTQKSLDVLQDRMDARFDKAAASESIQTGSISELQTSVMMLWCGQRRLSIKGCDAKSLVTQAKSVSKSQAMFLESATVQLTAGEKPQVASEEIKAQLPQEMTWGSVGVTTYYPKGKTADVLLWSAAAKSAHWSQEGDTVKVSFSNGDATFKFAPTTSKEHMTKLVDSLNATTEVLKVSEKK